MTPGVLARRLLGDRWFASVVEVYRSVFVDLDEVARCLPALPAETEILDLGGGALAERILRQQPGLRISIVDSGPRVGICLRGARRRRARLLASTSLREYGARGLPRPDLVLLADVLHHVPVAERATHAPARPGSPQLRPALRAGSAAWRRPGHRQLGQVSAGEPLTEKRRVLSASRAVTAPLASTSQRQGRQEPLPTAARRT